MSQRTPDRYRAFAAEYVRNGRNGRAAAITVGYAPKHAKVTACRMLKRPEVKALVEASTDIGAMASGLTIERTLREVARIAYSDPRKMFRADGSLIPITEMDANTAATVASIEHDSFERGEDGPSGVTTKLKVWDKNAALEKAMKHLGLYERDNAQRAPSLTLQVALIGPK